MGNWGKDHLNGLPKITQLVSNRTETWIHAVLLCTALPLGLHDIAKSQGQSQETWKAISLPDHQSQRTRNVNFWHYLLVKTFTQSQKYIDRTERGVCFLGMWSVLCYRTITPEMHTESICYCNLGIFLWISQWQLCNYVIYQLCDIIALYHICIKIIC